MIASVIPSELLGYCHLPVTLNREVFRFFRNKEHTTITANLCRTNLARREEFLAESLVVVSSRNFSALVVNVRIHTINTEVGLLLGERLKTRGKEIKIESSKRGIIQLCTLWKLTVNFKDRHHDNSNTSLGRENRETNTSII